MKHLKIYESFGEISGRMRDIFDLEYKKILKNRTVVRGPIYHQEEIEKLFSRRNQFDLIEECAGRWTIHGFTLDQSEVARAECAERNIKNLLGGELEKLECEVLHYRPMFIADDLGKKIKVYVPFSQEDELSGFQIPIKRCSRWSEEGKAEVDRIIPVVKKYAQDHGVTHVLPYGHSVLDSGRYYYLEEDTFRNGLKPDIFTPIEDFKWDRYYWF